MSVRDEIDRARTFGEKLEALLVRKGQCQSGDRETLLIGYWSLVFDFHKGILVLLSSESFGAAFALVRPVLETLVRAHLAVMGSDEEIKELAADKYRVNFKEIGPRIDKAFGYRGLIEKVLSSGLDAFHSYTHAGTMQLSRRFAGNDVKPGYSDESIVEVVHSTTSAAWMVTNLITKHFKFEDEWKAAGDLFAEYGKP